MNEELKPQEKKDWCKITKEALIKFFKSFTLFEILFLVISLAAVIPTSIVFNSSGISIAFSVLSIISLLMLSKGVFIAPIYIIVRCAVYAVQTYQLGLYGETILNACIIIPLQIATMITWALNKKKHSEIQINTIGWKEWLCIVVCALALIAPVYFMLNAFETKYIALSVATFILPIVSYYLTFRRSVMQFAVSIIQSCVLIVLWLMPVFLGEQGGLGLVPTSITFGAYLVCNIYGLWNWRRKHKEQIAERQQNVARLEK